MSYRKIPVFIVLWTIAFSCLAQTTVEPIELHVWGLSMSAPRVGWYALVDAFERKYPHIKVVIGPADRGSDMQKLLCGIVGDSPPDVFKREAMLLGDISARDIIRPLDSFVEADRAIPNGVHKENYPEGLWESCRGQDGHIYGIPEGINALLLAYNKDNFRRAGLDPENPPQTWEAWLDAARKMTRYDDRGRVLELGCMIHTEYSIDDLVFYMQQLGAKVISDDGRTCLLDQPEALEALKFVSAMYEATGGRKAFDTFAQYLEGTGRCPLGDGGIAMLVGDDWTIDSVITRAPDMDLGIIPVPHPAGRPPISTSAKHGVYHIPINARHPEEAWLFIRFATSPEGMLEYYRAIVAADPTATTATKYPGLWADKRTMNAIAEKYGPKEPMYAAAYDEARNILQYTVPTINSPVSAVLRDECRRAVNRVLYGEMGPEEAILDADRRVQEQLDLFFKQDTYPLLNWTAVWSALAVVIIGAVAYFWWRSREEHAYTSLQRHENRMGLLFISPWIVGFVVFIAGPMVFSLAISFCDYDVIHAARFVGPQNYSFLLQKDPLFWKSLYNTAFMVLAIPVTMTVALLIALLLNASVKGMSVYRTIFYLPAITPAVATAVLWYALLNPEGLINTALEATLGRWFGFHAPAWLGDAHWSKPAIVLMQLWTAGGNMILWLAGLQSIPKQYYEAASIDGAGKIRQFFSVTLPMLTPYIFFTFVTGIIGVFQIFAQALVLTRGGPADSTLFYVYYLFNNAFRYFKMGYASAQAWILFIIVMILTLIQWRMAKRWVHYG